MADRFFGELPGVIVGSRWPSRTEASKAGVHRPPMAGISGTAKDGADSIVVSGGYEDDQDLGDEIIYTGAGGNDPGTKKQIADQTLTQPGNAGLVTSQLNGLPVRVIRGAHAGSAHAPADGFRYDGLYRVADHWSHVGKSGFRIWRFRLLRLTPQESAPYVPGGNVPTGTTRPGTTTGIVTRIVRDTAVSRSVKALYDSTCQICDMKLEVPGGAIAEGAHIRALGKPHSGPDVPSNVLCLCPNHHTLFDAGGIYVTDDYRVCDLTGVTIGPLTRRAAHPIDQAQIAYHRGLWGY